MCAFLEQHELMRTHIYRAPQPEAQEAEDLYPILTFFVICFLILSCLHNYISRAWFVCMVYDNTFIKLTSQKLVLKKGYYCIEVGREKLSGLK